jgi:hypothetical protein
VIVAWLSLFLPAEVIKEIIVRNHLLVYEDVLAILQFLDITSDIALTLTIPKRDKTKWIL